ncbi:MAG: TetR/AcrR family transcriptional regulator [Myxococcota bacterium]|jgi:AcrR family transcriptional regulator|nr:TetR/AcrR family transcriptional regulator [bacterium]MDP6075526.1 TetR/AcrR family transcriptional regulator [Myxococcota bacterium]MDP6243673.1 TetR/AcrR family transcriptional regulator [Myxococcota bacterium]MDP7075974.1 TetR/AcrR family transcriptional regulator [Myxococcota bacterium]MDP7300164.1 TetR/AcrR family transcriptional regulator [Myxococcota bacterium]
MPLREEKKAQSRRRILESAREVFFRDGFMQANLDEVAEKAGVAKGTLYRYFESKAELYVAVLAHNGAIFEAKMQESVDITLPAPEQIRRTARFYFSHYMDNRDYFKIFWAIENQSVIGELPQGVVDEVARLWERCLEIMAEIIARGVNDGAFAECDSWEMANLLWTVANALIQTETSSTRRKLRRAPLEQTFEAAIEVFLRGLAPENAVSPAR